MLRKTRLVLFLTIIAVSAASSVGQKTAGGKFNDAIKRSEASAEIITRDLLDLMRWDTDEGRDFQSRFRQLKILDPVEFLKQLEA